MRKPSRRWVTMIGAGFALAVVAPTILDGLLRVRFNSSIADVRDGDITSIRFKPHVDREFVTISDPKVIRRIQDWFGTSQTPKTFYSYPPTTCPLEVTLANGGVERFDISPTGLTATCIVELDANGSFERQHQLSYVMLSYNGQYRLVSNQPLTPFLLATNQLGPVVP